MMTIKRPMTIPTTEGFLHPIPASLEGNMEYVISHSEANANLQNESTKIGYVSGAVTIHGQKIAGFRVTLPGRESGLCVRIDGQLYMLCETAERVWCEHEWHRYGTVNGVPDIGCQKCGATQNA